MPQWSPLIRPMAVTKNPANGQRGKTIGWAASDGAPLIGISIPSLRLCL